MKYIVSILLLSISTAVYSQRLEHADFQASGYSPDAGNSGVQRMPNNNATIRQQLNQLLPESQVWDLNFAKSGNCPDGGTVYCFATEGDDLYIGGDFFW